MTKKKPSNGIIERDGRYYMLCSPAEVEIRIENVKKANDN